MKKIFVDTSGWGHLADPRQEFAQQASAFYREARGQGGVITSNYVIAELTALLISPLRVKGSKRIEIINGIRSSGYIEIVHVDASVDERAWNLLEERPDKDWSLVDATSFILMQQIGITEALTTDHNFEQAGFIRLLKTDVR